MQRNESFAFGCLSCDTLRPSKSAEFFDRFLGIVSKPVHKPIDKLTTFQEIPGVSIRRKQHSNRHLESLNTIEQAVKVVNRRLGSLRQSPQKIS